MALFHIRDDRVLRLAIWSAGADHRRARNATIGRFIAYAHPRVIPDKVFGRYNLIDSLWLLKIDPRGFIDDFAWR